jgi:hypothetical protein
MIIRIEQRVFIARHVVGHVTTPSCLTDIYRCIKTRSKEYMITSSRKVSNQDSPTLRSSFPSAILRTLKVKCKGFGVFIPSFCSIIHGSSWRLTPKQDFLVCFLGGNLLLSATRSGALVQKVSVPPRSEELSEIGKRDWTTGIELIRTCMATHETKTYVLLFNKTMFVPQLVTRLRLHRGLAPEIVHFRIPSDNMGEMRNVPGDWYIKGAGCGHFLPFVSRTLLTCTRSVGEFPPYDARYMLRHVLTLFFGPEPFS